MTIYFDHSRGAEDNKRTLEEAVGVHLLSQEDRACSALS